jgi:hypothetical protein
MHRHVFTMLKSYGSLQTAQLNPCMVYEFLTYELGHEHVNTEPRFLSLYSNWATIYGQGSVSDKGIQGILFSLFVTVCTLGMGPTYPPVQWVPGTLSPEEELPLYVADQSSVLVPRLKTRGAILPLPHTSYCRDA